MLQRLIRTAHKTTGHRYDSLDVVRRAPHSYTVTLRDTRATTIALSAEVYLSPTASHIYEAHGQLSHIGWSHDCIKSMIRLLPAVDAGIESNMQRDGERYYVTAGNMDRLLSGVEN